MSNYPKVVALDLDWTLWKGHLNAKKWGVSRRAASPQEDNIDGVSDTTIRDRSDSDNELKLFPDVGKVIGDIINNGAECAIVSRNSSKAMTDRALWHLKIWNPKKSRMVPIIDVVKYDEVYNKSKTEHFKAIQSYRGAGSSYRDMILFDDETRNNEVEVLLGVTFKACRDGKGLTWKNYNDGIEMWRRNKSIERSFVPISIAGKLSEKHYFVGYCGHVRTTLERLEKGQRRIDQEHPARWGYGLYVTDDPRVAKYFSGPKWSGGKPSAVCRVYARDRDAFLKLPKIWVPEDSDLQTNNTGRNAKPSTIGDSQEDRDDWVRDRGVKKPYVLFSKHHHMRNMPVPDDQRFNEMAIYPQLQDALFFAIVMQSAELERDMQLWERGGTRMRYDRSVSSWGITVPRETRKEIEDEDEKLT